MAFKSANLDHMTNHSDSGSSMDLNENGTDEVQSIASSSTSDCDKIQKLRNELNQFKEQTRAEIREMRRGMEQQMLSMSHAIHQLMMKRSSSEESLDGSSNSNLRIPRAFRLPKGAGDVSPPLTPPADLVGTNLGVPYEQPPAVSLSTYAPVDEDVVPSLSIEGITQKWYTKRAFPMFKVHLINSHAVQLKSSPSEDRGDHGHDGNLHHRMDSRLLGRGFQIRQQLEPAVHVRLLTADDRYADDLLSFHGGQSRFPIRNGVADLEGIKFSAVTSRHGGHYTLEFTVPGTNIVSVKSEPIVVLSERLRVEGKAASIYELKADDNLARVPGIGKKYASRLAEQNFRTIRDLVVINSPAKQKTLLSLIRKDRGALTEAKLEDLLRDARAIVRRDDEAIAAEGGGPAPSTAVDRGNECNTDHSESVESVDDDDADDELYDGYDHSPATMPRADHRSVVRGAGKFAGKRVPGNMASQIRHQLMFKQRQHGRRQLDGQNHTDGRYVNEQYAPHERTRIYSKRQKLGQPSQPPQIPPSNLAPEAHLPTPINFVATGVYPSAPTAMSPSSTEGTQNSRTKGAEDVWFPATPEWRGGSDGHQTIASSQGQQAATTVTDKGAQQKLLVKASPMGVVIAKEPEIEIHESDAEVEDKACHEVDQMINLGGDGPTNFSDLNDFDLTSAF